jgi:hypothetical protein
MPFDLIYNSTCFEKFLLKNHFVDYYTTHLPNDKKQNLKTSLDRYAADITTYLSYAVMDKMLLSGYGFPKKNGQRLVEVKSIVVDNKTNILNTDKNYGDIDVLAFDNIKKEILNIEIKHYVPAMSISKLNSKIELEKREKHVAKVNERERILKDNISIVLQFLDADVHNSDEYSVRSIFLTIRPDYWLKNYDYDIEYMSLVDFVSEFNIG